MTWTQQERFTLLRDLDRIRYLLERIDRRLAGAGMAEYAEGPVKIGLDMPDVQYDPEEDHMG